MKQAEHQTGWGGGAVSGGREGELHHAIGGGEGGSMEVERGWATVGDILEEESKGTVSKPCIYTVSKPCIYDNKRVSTCLAKGTIRQTIYKLVMKTVFEVYPEGVHPCPSHD
jgi:hypothetical protein